MNFNLSNHITNNSAVNRIHLVIDATVNELVTAMFNSPAITVKKETDDTPIISPETKLSSPGNEHKGQQPNGRRNGARVI